MKNLIINSILNYIQKYYNYSDIKIKEIKYGLESIYLSFSKLIFISIVALILGIFKEMIIFTLIYNLLRIPSFGLHATKSWICLVSSTIAFICIPYLCINLEIQVLIKVIIGIIGIILMFKNSPADTKKKPIINKKRREKYKFISVILTIIFAFISILINNTFLSNCFICAIILQNIMISPITYKIFGLSYNNYINFYNEHPEFAK